MKTIRSLRCLSLVLCFMISGALVFAQEKEAEKQQQTEMEEQMRIRKQMLEQQQEQMKEQMKQQQEQMKQQHEQIKEMQKQFEVQIKELPHISAESLKLPVLKRSDLDFGTGKSFDYHFFNSFDQGTHSQLTLRKKFNGTTDTSKGEFHVEEDIRNFRCMIRGTVESGEIFIRVQYPGGKVFKDLTINSSADLDFSQSVSIGEEEKSRYTGTWSYVIKADKAVGQYTLQISTN